MSHTSIIVPTTPNSETTQLTARLDRLQAVRTLSTAPVKKPRRKRNLTLPLLALAVLTYFIAPFRTNILFLGTDVSPERGTLGRTDTIILATVVPLKPYVGLLSIPRDLWVQVPNVGEQRINTAYFYAEAGQPGTGGAAAAQTVRENFGVPVHYYVILQMGGLASVIDSVGGVDVQLDEPMGGLSAGAHHLDGSAGLAFARNRNVGDDFGRMQGAQMLLSALLRKALQPATWPDLPQLAFALAQTVRTNIPLWQVPRLLFALVRAPLFGFDSHAIDREMVTPYVTSQGAQVLLPNWESINLLLHDMFGR